MSADAARARAAQAKADVKAGKADPRVPVTVLTGAFPRPRLKRVRTRGVALPGGLPDTPGAAARGRRPDAGGARGLPVADHPTHAGPCPCGWSSPPPRAVAVMTGCRFPSFAAPTPARQGAAAAASLTPFPLLSPLLSPLFSPSPPRHAVMALSLYRKQRENTC